MDKKLEKERLAYFDEGVVAYPNPTQNIIVCVPSRKQYFIFSVFSFMCIFYTKRTVAVIRFYSIALPPVTIQHASAEITNAPV